MNILGPIEHGGEMSQHTSLALCRILGTKCVTCPYIDKFAPFHNQMSVIHNIFVKFL